MTSRNYRIYDQQLLNIYVNMYEQTAHHIETLYDYLSEIRESIELLSGLRNRVNRTERNSNRNRERRYETNGHTFNSIPRSTTVPMINTRESLASVLQNFREDSSRSRLWNTLGFGNISNFFDSVPVAPTQEQIENATRIVPFSSIENPTNTSCPITLDVFDEDRSVTQILHCGHIFDNTAFTNWFRSHTQCPVCRQDIRVAPQRPAVEEPEISYTVQIEEVDRNDEPQPQPQILPTPSSNSSPTLETTSSSRQESRQEQPRSSSLFSREEISESLPFTEEEIVNRFTNLTESLLNNLLNVPSNEDRLNPNTTRFYVDSSNNIIFESFLRNSFR
jgi:Ring finger domain